MEGFWSISGIEQKRLWQVFQDEHSNGFIVFDSGSKRIAVNPRHLLFWQFLWDAPCRGLLKSEEKAGPLTIFFAHGGEPIEFGVDADSAQVNEEVEDDRAVQLQNMLQLLEIVGANEDITGVVSFDDEDGEQVFFRPADVSLVEVPLWAVEPELHTDDSEEEVDAETVSSAASVGSQVQ